MHGKYRVPSQYIMSVAKFTELALSNGTKNRRRLGSKPVPASFVSSTTQPFPRDVLLRVLGVVTEEIEVDNGSLFLNENDHKGTLLTSK